MRRLAPLAVTTLLLGSALVGLTAGPAQASPTGLAITEVAPWASGSSPYAADWFELTNNGATPLALAGWKIDDDSATASLAAPLSGVTSLAAGESAIFLEMGSTSPVAGFRSFWNLPSTVQVGTYTGAGVGLSTGGDAVNIYDASGTKLAGVTFGASPAAAPFASFDNAAGVDGPISTLSSAGTRGAYAAGSGTTAAIGSPGSTTGGTTTATPPPATPTPSAPATSPWPGGQDLTIVDNADLSPGNLSGLTYTGSGSAATGTLWAVQNGPSVLHELTFDGAHWVDAPGTPAGGFALKYPTGTGDPDAEGVTIGGPTPASGVFVSTERDNTVNTVSKLAVLKYDASATTSPLNASKQWDLTSAIPATGPNLGLEAITWIPDSFLVGKGLVDSSTGSAYAPSSYPDHGTGLFFVGVEGSGMVYGFALDQAGTTYHLVTQFTSGFSTVMELTYDPDSTELWAHCDNTCNNVSTILRITNGTFAVAARYDRPTGMAATMNNEGYAIAPATECVNGLKPVYFSDDGDTDGFSLRRGSLTCAPLLATVPASLPEFGAPALALLVVLVLCGVALLLRRQAVFQGGASSSPTR